MMNVPPSFSPRTRWRRALGFTERIAEIDGR
jgi:hypothetical protein